jgi:hypothetical protein
MRIINDIRNIRLKETVQAENGNKPMMEEHSDTMELNKRYELTNQHFDIFVEEFNYWVSEYSLNNWEYHFNFGPDGSADNSRAHIYRDHPSRICLVFLNNIWEGTDPSEISVRHVAFHEAAEMLLSKLNDLVNSRSVIKDELEEAIHVVIRTLENTHWQLDIDTRMGAPLPEMINLEDDPE